eukprot:722515-Alexandrium_andersonii.AAC.1
MRGGRVRHPPAELLSREPQVRTVKAEVVRPCCQCPKIPALREARLLVGLCVAPIARKGDPAD